MVPTFSPHHPPLAEVVDHVHGSSKDGPPLLPLLTGAVYHTRARIRGWSPPAPSFVEAELGPQSPRHPHPWRQGIRRHEIFPLSVHEPRDGFLLLGRPAPLRHDRGVEPEGPLGADEAIGVFIEHPRLNVDDPSRPPARVRHGPAEHVPVEREVLVIRRIVVVGGRSPRGTVPWIQRRGPGRRGGCRRRRRADLRGQSRVLCQPPDAEVRQLDAHVPSLAAACCVLAGAVSWTLSKQGEKQEYFNNFFDKLSQVGVSRVQGATRKK